MASSSKKEAVSKKGAVASSRKKATAKSKHKKTTAFIPLLVDFIF